MVILTARELQIMQWVKRRAENYRWRKQKQMNANISIRRCLQATFFGVLLSLALLLSLTVQATPAAAQQPDQDDANKPAAQQPDNDNMNRPAAPKPDTGDRNQPAAGKSDTDKPQAREPDKDEMNRPAAQRPERDISRSELADWDQFLDKHPEIDNDLKKNPSLVDDQSYLTKHPDLKAFLESHPGVRQQLKKNANTFMKREQKYEKHEPQKH